MEKKKGMVVIDKTDEADSTSGEKKITVENYVFPPDVGKYKILSFDAFLAKNMKHDRQLAQIKQSCDIFDDFRRNINEAILEQKQIDEWVNYLACDGYPLTHIPANIREFLYQIETFEKELYEKTDSWILSIDERSILTQDIDARITTRPALKPFRIDYGNKYDSFIGRLLGVLKLLENTIKTGYKVPSASIQTDLEKLKIETHYKIKDLIEKLSYKIIANTESQMIKKTVHTSEFVCNTNNFRMYVWTFQNVPMVIDKHRFQKVNIPIECMTAKVSLPLNVLEPNLTLRVIQLNYDHYSEFVPSYHEVQNPFRANFRDLLISEWEKKLEMQNKIKEKLLKERAEYEEYLIAKEELEAKLKALRMSPADKKKEKPKKKKVQIEPPIILPDEVPDIENDFRDQEDLAYITVMEDLHPRKYEFDENEVNMRQFIPLGGIYEINFLVKPAQIIYPFVAVGLKSDVLPCTLRTVMKKCPHEPGTEIDSTASEINERHTNILCFYVIKVQIPTKYVKWAEPIPCQFIPGYDVVGPEKKRTVSLNFYNNLLNPAKRNTDFRKTRKSRRVTTTDIQVKRNTLRQTVKSSRKSKKLVPNLSAESSFTDIVVEKEDFKGPSFIAVGTIRAAKGGGDIEPTTKWTTKNILKKRFDKEKGEMKIWTDRLGIFAFMYPRYIHFPYKNWSLTSTNPSEVLFVVDSSLAKFMFKITDRGYIPMVTNHYEKFSDRKTYLQILEPVSDIDELKNIMIDQNLNLFPAIDTGYYLEDEHFSQKLCALESHTYDCMAAYSTFIQFQRSEWNCIAGYRNIILKCGENGIVTGKALDLVQINSEVARYVYIEEACTDISEVILNYRIARETDFAADLFNLIISSYPGSYYSRVRNAKLFLYVSEILKTIQPLSFA